MRGLAEFRTDREIATHNPDVAGFDKVLRSEIGLPAPRRTDEDDNVGRGGLEVVRRARDEGGVCGSKERDCRHERSEREKRREERREKQRTVLVVLAATPPLERPTLALLPPEEELAGREELDADVPGELCKKGENQSEEAASGKERGRIAIIVLETVALAGGVADVERLGEVCIVQSKPKH